MEQLLNVSIPLWAVAAYLVFQCFVQALPRPEEGSSKLYIWAYQFAHLLCMNLALVIDTTKKLKTSQAAPEVPLKP